MIQSHDSNVGPRTKPNGQKLLGKRIVILSDGTGNSASAVFKTNVWRLYQSLDQSERTEDGAPRQIAFYDDGVGTSSFRPLALLGGAFGVGLKRNVLDLYQFICRNYEPGDQIYAFGFSRGAFTVRVTVGLLAQEGVVRCDTEEALSRYTKDAYRELRRCFKQTGGLVTFFRRLRDIFLYGQRRLWAHPLYSEIRKGNAQLDEIGFVGVWDTVAAYGMPISELTRGIDRWVWPLSMPDYVLSPKVKTARHALALDDERDTFHPLLWDEVAEARHVAEGKVSADRLKQVWFSGMHSDIGGGYPEDALARVPLLWMIEEASEHGLRFKSTAVHAIKERANHLAPLHDSRGGLGSYYRLQPRKLSARMDPPDPTTLVMQDPEMRGGGLLTSAMIHESVFDRITVGTDRAAPTVLPSAYQVVHRDGTVSSGPEEVPEARAMRQERVWNQVWKRRINYFSILGVSFALALLPLFVDADGSTCIGPGCLAVPLISAVGYVLPDFADYWLAAYAAVPGVFIIAVLVLSILVWRSSILKRRAHDDMRALWDESLPKSPGLAPTQSGEAVLPHDWIYRLRSNRVYQHTLQFMKWRLAPAAFGIALLAALFLAVLGLVLRVAIEATSLFPAFCGSAGPPGSATAPATFETSALCWRSGYQVEEDRRYRVQIKTGEDWTDGPIRASPAGFGHDRFPWHSRHAALLLRRSLLDRWFQPIATIVPDGFGANHSQALSMRWIDQGTFEADFTASRDGVLFIFVNDAIVPIPWLAKAFYRNNGGTAEVTVMPDP
jgi:uncharacterized protein (DUF2235 family)